MAQISRPYQIALGALVVAALMWFLAFGHHSSSTGGSSSSPPAQPSQSANGGSVNGSSHIYHGSAPGVEGLTKDIAKAHGAAATSESYNHHLEEKSAAATSTTQGEASAAGSPAASTPAAKAPATSNATKAAAHAHAKAHATTPAAGTHSHTVVVRTHTTTRTHTQAKTAPAVKAHPKHAAPISAVPSGQRAVEAALAKGKVALLLFWNPVGSADVAVHKQVGALRSHHLPVVVFEGNSKSAASYGSITRAVPVYGTPTILIVGAKGRTIVLTGLQDVFAIEQAIREARKSSS
jgi:hypothetical protein